MTNVYISFGQAHAHSVAGRTFDKDSIAIIKCENYTDGRRLAFQYFNGKFHNCWSEEEFDDDKLSYFPRGLIKAN